MNKLRQDFGNILAALVLSMLFSIVCNIVGYDIGISKSLPGLLVLVALSLAGFVLSYIVPVKKITSVLWISLIAILISSPISPVSEQVISLVGKVSLMSVVTPILAYAGILVGKDWFEFKKLGFKAVIVSIIVIAGTFLVSSLMGDFFMMIFG